MYCFELWWYFLVHGAGYIYCFELWWYFLVRGAGYIYYFEFWWFFTERQRQCHTSVIASCHRVTSIRCTAAECLFSCTLTWWLCRCITSKNRVGRSCIGLVKICSRYPLSSKSTRIFSFWSCREETRKSQWKQPVKTILLEQEPSHH